MVSVLLLFMYLFSFPVAFLPSILNSSRLVFLFLLVLLFIDPAYRTMNIHIIKKKKIRWIFSLLLVVILFNCLIPVIKGTSDYSIVSTFLNQFVMLLTGLMVFAYFFTKKKKISFYIIYCFILQSFIQIGSFLSSDIRSMFDIFRSEATIEIGQGYGNIRSLGLSGSAFFGLAVGYAICYVLYLYYWDEFPIKNSLVKLLLFLGLLFGGQSAGRISIVGAIIGLVLFFYKKFPYKKKTRTLKFYLVGSLILIVLLIFGIYLMNYENESVAKSIDTYKNFVFQMFYSYRDTGEFSTSSTDYLFNNMYFSIPSETLLLGDGRYTEANGSYYMFTDAGYMRNILFSGVTGLLLLCAYQLQFFNWKNGSKWALNIGLLLVIFSCHVKGEVLSFLIISQSLLILLFCEDYFFDRKDLEEWI